MYHTRMLIAKHFMCHSYVQPINQRILSLPTDMLGACSASLDNKWKIGNFYAYVVITHIKIMHRLPTFTHKHFSMSIAKQVREFNSLGTDPDTVGMDGKKYRDLGPKKLNKKPKGRNRF
jgi:hypothetical protein